MRTQLGRYQEVKVDSKPIVKVKLDGTTTGPAAAVTSSGEIFVVYQHDKNRSLQVSDPLERILYFS